MIKIDKKMKCFMRLGICLLNANFLTVMPKDMFRNPIKSLWRSVFAKIVNNA